MNFHSSENTHSTITTILPRNRSTQVVDAILEAPNRSLLSLNSRGTLVKDRWYQFLLPAMNPEQEVLHLVVANEHVDTMMQTIVSAGQLSYSGAGAIYSMPCNCIHYSEEYTICCADKDANKEPAQIAPLKENLVAIYCIVQSQMSDSVARAALKAGAHGPNIYYCEGRGLRDRLGVLRITQNAEKEVIQVITNPFDAEIIFDTMASAAQIDQPGRGIIFKMPVSKGIINIESISGASKHSANMRQIISAIDDLKEGHEWRAHGMTEEGESSYTNFMRFGRSREKRSLQELEKITCMIKRKHADSLLDGALAAGAPAASTTYGKSIVSGCAQTAAGLRLNHEHGMINMILPAATTPKIVQTLRDVAEKTEIEEMCIYSQSVPQAMTYLGAMKS